MLFPEENADLYLVPFSLYKSLALVAVKSLHGDMGMPSEIDVLEVLSDGSAIISVDHRCVLQERMWSAFSPKVVVHHVTDVDPMVLLRGMYYVTEKVVGPGLESQVAS